jgi:RHS repeat-associated protein
LAREGGNRWKYNATSELNPSTNWYETDFRPYDQQVGRFTGVDALAEKFMSLTPFHYSYNNPMSFNDPTGLSPNYTYNWEKERYEDEEGNEVSWETVHGSIKDDTWAVVWNRDIESNPKRYTPTIHIFSYTNQDGSKQVKNMDSIRRYVERIYSLNGFKVNVKVIDVKYGEELPLFDRDAYIGITTVKSDRVSEVGEGNAGNIRTISGRMLHTDGVVLADNASYKTGYVVAHEAWHQMLELARATLFPNEYSPKFTGQPSKFPEHLNGSGVPLNLNWRGDEIIHPFPGTQLNPAERLDAVQRFFVNFYLLRLGMDK